MVDVYSLFQKSQQSFDKNIREETVDEVTNSLEEVVNLEPDGEITAQIEKKLLSVIVRN